MGVGDFSATVGNLEADEIGVAGVKKKKGKNKKKATANWTGWLNGSIKLGLQLGSINKIN